MSAPRRAPCRAVGWPPRGPRAGRPEEAMMNLRNEREAGEAGLKHSAAPSLRAGELWPGACGFLTHGAGQRVSRPDRDAFQRGGW